MEQGGISIDFDLPYSNQPPSKADAARAYIKLKALELELLQADTELSLLLAKRGRLVHQILRCKTVVAPHKKLPPELIREIISACAAASRVKVLPLDKDERDPRLVMTQICSSWRQAAFGISDLWNVTFSCNDPPQGSVLLANSWFSQSSGSALALKTGRLSRSITSQWLSRATFVLAELVLPHSRRITTLDLDINVAQWNMIRSQPFHHLITLCLPPKLVSRTDHPGELVSCPSLRSVHVKATGNDDDVLFLPRLPWAQLTDLSLSGNFSAGSLPQFLALCTSLKNLEINRIALNSNAPLSGTLIPLPCLESLSIVYTSPRLFDLLAQFRAPCISSIKLDTLPKNEEGILKFTAFISSIAETLLHFEIARAGWHGFVRQEYLTPMVSLTHFLVPYGHFFTLGSLALIGTGSLLPNIEHLNFSASQNEGKIVDMLVARHAYNTHFEQKSKLRRVDILSQGIRWGDLERTKLQSLRLQGMNINVIHSRY